MKFRAIQAEKASYPVALMCACLSVSRSGYYAWESRPESGRVLDDKRMAGEVEAVFKTSRRTYGYPRIYRDLQNKGRRIGRHRVARLMREQGLQSIHRRRFRVTTTHHREGIWVDEDHGRATPHPTVRAAEVGNRLARHRHRVQSAQNVQAGGHRVMRSSVSVNDHIV